MDALILATSTYGDAFAAEWQPDLRLTVSYLRRNGIDVGYRYEAVPDAKALASSTTEPAFVYVDVTEENRDFVLPFLRELREVWRSRIVAGGLVATLVPTDVAPYCDFVVAGERETALLEIFRGRVPSPSRALLDDLDVLGTIVHDGLESVIGDGVGSLMSSRGCYAYCSFCGVPDFYRHLPGRFWRGRSAVVVVDEMEQLVDELGVRTFVFQDDNFIGPVRGGRERAQTIAREILRRHLDVHFSFCCRLNDVHAETILALKDAGLCGLGVSLESANQESLDLFRKGLLADAIVPALERLEALEVPCEINMIFFDPRLTLAGVRRNLEMLARIRESTWLRYSDAFPFNELLAFPWSRIAATLRSDGVVSYRDTAVARLTGFVATLRSHTGITFKKRLLFDSLEPLVSANSRATAFEALAEVAPALRHWLGLSVLPDVIAEACDLLEAHGPAADLSGVEARFVREITPLRQLESEIGAASREPVGSHAAK